MLALFPLSKVFFGILMLVVWVGGIVLVTTNHAQSQTPILTHWLWRVLGGGCGIILGVLLPIVWYDWRVFPSDSHTADAGMAGLGVVIQLPVVVLLSVLGGSIGGYWRRSCWHTVSGAIVGAARGSLIGCLLIFARVG